MERVTCGYCGLPLRVRRVQPGEVRFCCTGCALASRVPVDGQGQFPVNAHLVSALAVGFLFFNQLLFWLVAELLVRESKMVLALRFYWLAAAAALGVWLALVLLQWRERSGRARDGWAAAVALGMFIAAARRMPPYPFEMACASVAYLAWSMRGFIRKLVTRKG